MSREAVLAAIRAGAATGRRGIGPDGFVSRRVAQSAAYRFGSVRAAVIAGGLDPGSLLHTSRHDMREIRARVEELAQTRPDMTANDFSAHRLAAIIRARLGNVRATLRTWGVHDWPKLAASLRRDRAT